MMRLVNRLTRCGSWPSRPEQRRPSQASALRLSGSVMTTNRRPASGFPAREVDQPRRHPRPSADFQQFLHDGILFVLDVELELIDEGFLLASAAEILFEPVPQSIEVDWKRKQLEIHLDDVAGEDGSGGPNLSFRTRVP